MPDQADVVFALERFELGEDDRLEVVGRWEGLEGKRIGRAVLTVVEAGGRRRRLQALPRDRSAGEQPWRASFAWTGDPAAIQKAELELGRRLVVELPPPRRRRRRSAGTGALAAPAADSAALRAELEDARAARHRLEGLLATSRRELAALREELAATARERDELREAAERDATARAEHEQELETIRERLAAAQAEVADRDRRILEAERAADEAREEAKRAAGAREEAERAAAGAREEAERAAAESFRAPRVARPHRLPDPGRSAVEVWGTRLAALLLAGMLLVALGLILVRVL